MAGVIRALEIQLPLSSYSTSILNVLLDLVFVIVFQMGVQVCVATIISHLSGINCIIWFIQSENASYAIKKFKLIEILSNVFD